MARRSNSAEKPSPQRSPATATAQRELAPAAALPSVYVRSATQYPLLYKKRIAKADDRAKPGDLVTVYSDEEEQLLGYGLYNPRSEIVVRMIRHGPELPDANFWHARLDGAVHLRRETLKLDAETNAYRVVHAEGDMLSGLVVDKLGDVLSAEAFSLGMFQRAEAVLAHLQSRLGTKHTLVRTSPQFLSQEGYAPDPLASPELPERVTIQEHGTKFYVGFAGGHKTGFFCDQRENRRRLAEFCPGKTVLDLCCYTGGFAVQALALGQAAEVTGVDLDEEPLELARENAKLNRVKGHFVQADVFAYMRDMLRNGKQYDVVVLDPPKLIRSRAEYDEGTKKHYDLNRLAVQLVKPGGLLLTCSCAGLLPEEEFLRLVCSAAKNARPQEDASAVASTESKPRHPGRSVQILAKSGAAADHPVAGNYPESEYLKAVWMVVN